MITHCTFDDIPFDISGPVSADWTIRAERRKEHVPYSNITIVEHIGHAPARVTWDLLFPSRDDWFAFVARAATPAPGTLVMPANLQSLKGTQGFIGEPPMVMDILDNVYVDEIGTNTMYRDGRVKASVTFERQVDPVTRLAVVT